jgi:hypothetical protein
LHKKGGGGEQRKEVNLSKYSFTDRKIKIENVAMETQILSIIRQQGFKSPCTLGLVAIH